MPPNSSSSTSTSIPKIIGIDFGKNVYVPHDYDGYQIGKLVDIKSDGLVVEILNNNNDKIQQQFQHDQVFPAEEKRGDVDDNCQLMYLNEATLLQNCKNRYKRKQIYTYVANILISINPYEQISDLYSIKTIKTYNGKSLGTMPPHIFAIADMAYRDMKRLKQSQSVIVSGESGAGKTESQKCILRYLCDSFGGTGEIEKRLLETNPILEAFGNAKTLRNNNSSRFGKFVEIHFNSKFNVAGGYVSHYLLEKSRLCHQSPGERNYHIFYQLLAGLDDKTLKEWNLQSPDHYRYLSSGCTQFFASSSSKSKISASRMPKGASTLFDDLVDDYSDFQKLKQSLLDTGLDPTKRDLIFQLIAGILHLGNVEFEDNVEDSKGGCMISPSSMSSLKMASKLLGVDEFELQHGLISRVMQPNKGGVQGTMIRVPLKEREAANARDALTKAIYSRVFDEIVASINKSIPFTDSKNYIGVLDIAGFEFFAINSFEQFCINYCNEKLQQFFNERILKHEQTLYAKEGLNVPRIEFADNQDCIELFETKPTGLLDLLDEEAKLPRPSPQHFTDMVHKMNKDHFRLTSPRKSRLREHRDMRDDEGFIIRHYAGAVCYQTLQFLDKNNDALHMSLEMLMETSTNSLIFELFKPKINANSTKTSPIKSGTKLLSPSVSNKFRLQLSTLLEKLKITGTHFVRCIKPNSTMEPTKFDGSQILSQLKCAGMPSVLKLMQKGFPSRTSFSDLYDMYKELLPPKLKRLDPRLFCKCLFHALGLNDIDYKFGMTKVFFRPGKFAEFDQLMKQDKEHMNALIAKVQSWLHRTRWKKAIYGAWSVIKLDRKIKYRAAALITIQSGLRGYITRKEEKPRLSLYKKALSLQSRFNDVGKLGTQLTSKSKAQWVERIKNFSISTKTLIQNIKTTKNVKILNDLDSNYVKLEKELNEIIIELKKQIILDKKEVEKMRELDKKMKDEKERQLLEIKNKKENDEKIKNLKENELKRQQDEVKRQEKIKLLERQLQQEKYEDDIKSKKLEQERLDSELAKRLAMEDGQNILEFNTRAQNSINNGSNHHNNNSKYDLTAWTYAQIRDTINNSNNLDLLFACKNELTKRLQHYHQWKAQNMPKQVSPVQRGPPLVMDQPVLHPEMYSSTKAPPPIQRYFKVPFATPSTSDRTSNNANQPTTPMTGLWYAHFDGQFVARQMEIYPSRPPVLLIAGRDDAVMCELTLEQTQLMRKKGAEIKPEEFEILWKKYNGPPYISNSTMK